MSLETNGIEFQGFLRENINGIRELDKVVLSEEQRNDVSDRMKRVLTREEDEYESSGLKLLLRGPKK